MNLINLKDYIKSQHEEDLEKTFKKLRSDHPLRRDVMDYQ